MASPELQSKVNQLTAKIEGDLTQVMDEIERLKLRPLGRSMHMCIVSCYDKAGKSGRKEQLEQCVQGCQGPNQRAGAAVQREVGGFQQRLNNSMQTCNDDAQAMVTPDVVQDARKMKGIEDGLLKCLQGAVEKGRGGLKPMKQRIEEQIKS